MRVDPADTRASGRGFGQNWITVGGNNEHNGWASLHYGPARQVLWEAQTLPSNLGMQVYVWDDYVLTTRYTFSPFTATLVCHDLWTGDTVWTRLYRPDGKFIPMGASHGRLYSRNFRESGHDSIFCTDIATGEILWQSRWTAPLGIVWCAVFPRTVTPLRPAPSSASHDWTTRPATRCGPIRALCPTPAPNGSR